MWNYALSECCAQLVSATLRERELSSCSDSCKWGCQELKCTRIVFSLHRGFVLDPVGGDMMLPQTA